MKLVQKQLLTAEDGLAKDADYATQQDHRVDQAPSVVRYHTWLQSDIFCSWGSELPHSYFQLPLCWVCIFFFPYCVCLLNSRMELLLKQPLFLYRKQKNTKKLWKIPLSALKSYKSPGFWRWCDWVSVQHCNNVSVTRLFFFPTGNKMWKKGSKKHQLVWSFLFSICFLFFSSKGGKKKTLPIHLCILSVSFIFYKSGRYDLLCNSLYNATYRKQK